MADSSKDRERDLKLALSEIEKEFNKGAILRLGEKATEAIEGISTGSLALDLALGGRGVPRGRIIEIFGSESSGKTSLALHIVANAQKAGGVVAYIDTEHALDPSWAKRLGVDLENLLVSQPSYAEEALRIAEMLVKSNAVDLIVIDSVAALVPKAELAGDIGEAHMALLARLMSQALRMLNPTIAKTRTCMIFINQIRQKVGVFFGSPETTPGGMALKFYSSVRMDVGRKGYIKKGDEPIGSEVEVKVVKNKVAPPFRKAKFELLFESGISKEGDVLNLAQEDKLIEKRGNSAYLYYGDIALGNGWEKSREFLRENPAVMDELVTKILEKRNKLNAQLVEREGEDEEEPKAAAPPPPPTGRKGRQSASARSAEESGT